MPRRPKVLMIAYACEPGRGSEPAVGWNYALQASRIADVLVITRANNRPVIESEMARNPVRGLSFYYYDLPPWMRLWKRGNRGALLYYMAWQVGAVAKAKNLHSGYRFDLVHHVTFVQPHLPVAAALLPIPLVWGPLSLNEAVPPLFEKEVLSVIERLWNHARAALNHWHGYNLPAVLARRRAAALLASDEEVAEGLLRDFRDRTFVIPSNFTEVEPGADPSREAGLFRVVMAGQLIGIKGFRLGLRAFQEFSTRKDVRAVVEVAGDGPARDDLERLALKLGVKARFHGNLTREQTRKLIATSHVLLHPSFEGGGQVVLEAMARGTPVICLDFGGAGKYVNTTCGIKVPLTSPGDVLRGLANALEMLYENPVLRVKLGSGGIARVKEEYDVRLLAGRLQQVYDFVLGEYGKRAKSNDGSQDRN